MNGRRPALADLIEAQSFIARESPRAVELIGGRIWEASQTLGDNPYIGRDGHVTGTREWVVQQENGDRFIFRTGSLRGTGMWS